MLSYTERGTIACGYKKPGGEGRGYVERCDSEELCVEVEVVVEIVAIDISAEVVTVDIAASAVVNVDEGSSASGEPGITPCGTPCWRCEDEGWGGESGDDAEKSSGRVTVTSLM